MSSETAAAGSLCFDHVLLADGLQHDRRLSFAANGRIIGIEKAPPGQRDGVLALPGMPNAHSHAFQRALAGRTEVPAGRDSFWSWRETMYAVANRLDADALRVVARQAFDDMLRAGFTSVAEFHYLHRGADLRHSADMGQAIIDAAGESGIRLSLLPVLYQHGGFGQAAQARQARFIYPSLDEFVDLIRLLGEAVTGVAPHSLRAVDCATIGAVIEALESVLSADFPVHIHIAEQRAEVDDCLARYGRTPIAHLCHELAVDQRFHLVHATHASDAERDALLERDATVVLCPLTEGYLGDGVFAARDFVACGGRIAIGSDSNSRIDAIEELRFLEYGQRLRDERRLCLADGQSMAQFLWQRTVSGGARSVARDVGALSVGNYCDLITLDTDASALAGAAPGQILDAWLTGGSGAQIKDVYVGGRRRPTDQDASRNAQFGALMRHLHD